jgi:hypothetical protein
MCASTDCWQVRTGVDAGAYTDLLFPAYLQLLPEHSGRYLTHGV